ncbi:MAG TPA: cysteine desulfurase [Gammaproteobacteria bacterium]|nr:cysteine desulfurase [Gammaproteobacteria bacterium]
MNKQAFNVNTIRKDFPALNQSVYGMPLAYLDNAATTQKPQCVIDALTHFYQHDNANVHRGVHALSERADKSYEAARSTIKEFIHAKSTQEIIFTRGATEGINLLAYSFGEAYVNEGDEIIISAMEHHANIVPWQLLCKRKGAKLIISPINDQGELDLSAFKTLLNARTRLVSITHMSNTLGTINPVAEIIEIAHQHNIPVLLDAAQSLPHSVIDVQALDCDFLVASGHKIYAPSGIGFVYGKKQWLDAMPPYQSGGAMIAQVSFEKTEFTHLPYKFEAGTPAIADAIGLGAALEFLNQYDRSAMLAHETALLNYAQEKMQSLNGLRIIGLARNKGSIISFVLDKVHPHDIATILDRKGVAIRAGHHCTMPLMQQFKVPATARASMSFYNTFAEIDQLIAALIETKEIFNDH